MTSAGDIHVHNQIDFSNHRSCWQQIQSESLGGRSGSMITVWNAQIFGRDFFTRLWHSELPELLFFYSRSSMQHFKCKFLVWAENRDLPRNQNSPWLSIHIRAFINHRFSHSLRKPINLPLNFPESAMKRSYRKVPIFGLRGGYSTSLEAFVF